MLFIPSFVTMVTAYEAIYQQICMNFNMEVVLVTEMPINHKTGVDMSTKMEFKSFV